MYLSPLSARHWVDNSNLIISKLAGVQLSLGRILTESQESCPVSSESFQAL